MGVSPDPEQRPKQQLPPEGHFHFKNSIVRPSDGDLKAGGVVVWSNL